MKSIWAKGLYKEQNISVAYQYAFTPSADAVINLAASNVYRLFVNGELIGYGPARAAHGYSRVDTYSFGKWIGEKTVLTVEVFSANANSFYTIEEPPFFAAEITDCGRVIAEASDFTAYRMTERVQKVRIFSYQRTFTEVYHLTGDPKAFFSGNTDGRTSLETEEVPMNELLPRYVNYPKLNTLPAGYVECGSVEIDPEFVFRGRWNHTNGPAGHRGFETKELEDDPCPVVESYVYKADGIDCGGRLTEKSYQTYDFTRTVTGFFKMKVTAHEDTTLYIIFDDIITERGTYKEVNPYRSTCINIIKYTLTPGEYNIISFEPNVARFASVIAGEGAADINEFGMVLYENPDATGFEYDYGDDELNRITAAAVNTFAQNAVDILTDCPSRERAGWLCDSYFSSRAEALFTGKNLVERSFLENYALFGKVCRPTGGMLPMCYPADHEDTYYIPNWSMWYILELRNYVNRTGDEKMREMSKDKVYGLVQFFEKYYNEDGLLENLESWVFIEWSKCNDDDHVKGVNYPSNMLWAAALEAVDELYSDALLAEKAAQMKKTIREQAWNGEFFDDNSDRDENGKLVLQNHLTETCQYYAFYFGVASKETDAELFEKMLTKFGPKRDDIKVYPDVGRSNAIVGNYLRLEILLGLGYYENVLSECRDFFLGMADLTGTLWEHAQLNASLNHGFASMAAVYIDECMKNR